MFRWCAYCWTFMGEREPLADFATTHGICERCVESEALLDEGIVERTRPMRELHQRLGEIATEGRVEDVAEVLREGASLGLGPVELLVGVLQPALYRVGRLWEIGQVTPKEEAQLTRFCAAALSALDAGQRERVGAGSGRPIVLLAARGNAHSLGLAMLAFVLREAGRVVLVRPAPPDADGVLALCEELDASAIGLSVALADHLPYVVDVARTLAREDRPRRVVVGGLAAEQLGEISPFVVRWTGRDSLLRAAALFA